MSIRINGTNTTANPGTTGADTDTGLVYGDNEVKIVTGGTDKVTVDSSGRLLVGTTAGAYKLVVSGGVATTGIVASILNPVSGGNSKIHFSDNATYNWTAGTVGNAFAITPTEASTSAGTPALFINSSGNVGVGTSSANALLHIESAAADAARLRIGFDAPRYYDIFRGSITNSGLLNFYGSQTGFTGYVFDSVDGERMRIDSSGRLGLGTSSPSGLLSIHQAASSTSNYINITNNATGTSSWSNGMLVGVNATGDALCWQNESSNLLFGTSNSERMRIDSSGRLLLGATAPVSGADANGLLQVSQNVGSNTCIIVAENTASSGNLSCFRARLRNSNPNNIFSAFLQCDASTGGSKAVIRSNGGLANYSANNVNLSDRNVKKDITAAADTWDCIKEWEIVNFRYKDQPDNADLNLGVIAQQVAESCPEVLTIFQEAKEATETEPAQEERLGVKEQQMHWMAIKALQEAIAKIETLEQRLSDAGIA